MCADSSRESAWAMDLDWCWTREIWSEGMYTYTYTLCFGTNFEKRDGPGLFRWMKMYCQSYALVKSLWGTLMHPCYTALYKHMHSACAAHDNTHSHFCTDFTLLFRCCNAKWNIPHAYEGSRKKRWWRLTGICCKWPSPLHPWFIIHHGLLQASVCKTMQTKAFHSCVLERCLTSPDCDGDITCSQQKSIRQHQCATGMTMCTIFWK